MSETRTIEIEGHSYTIELFGAKMGQRVFFRLVTFLGPMIGSAAGNGWKDIGPALETFARTATPEQFESLVEEFATKTTVTLTAQTNSGDRAVVMKLSTIYDQHFARRYRALFSWLLWAIKENFESFLDSGDSGGLNILALLGLVRSGSTAQKASTGFSGDPGSVPT